MLNTRLAIKTPKLPPLGGLLFGAALGAITIVAGSFAVIFPWWFAVGLVVALTAVCAALALPYQGMLLSLLLIFNAIPHQYFPKLPIGSGGIAIYDLLLVLLTFSVAAQNLIFSKCGWVDRLGNLFIPFVYLILCIAASLAYVKVFAPNRFALTEARQYIGWMLLPIGVFAINSPGKYRWFIRTLVIIGVVVASIVIVQSLANINIIGGRVESLDRYNSDVTRSTAGGAVYVIIFSIYLLLLGTLNHKISWWLSVPILLLLTGGLLVTFGRGVWIGTAIGLFIATYIFRGPRLAFVVPVVGLIFALISLGLVSVVNPRYSEAVADRVFGVSREMESGASFHWRLAENSMALSAIARRPLTGVGLGGDYKPTISTSDTFEGETRYIHNSYLLMPLKMGLQALLIPVLFVFAAWKLLRRAIAHGTESNNHIPAAAAGAFTVPIITSITQPEWATVAGIAAMCCLLLVLRLHADFSSPTATRKRNKGSREKFGRRHILNESINSGPLQQKGPTNWGLKTRAKLPVRSDLPVRSTNWGVR